MWNYTDMYNLQFNLPKAKKLLPPKKNESKFLAMAKLIKLGRFSLTKAIGFTFVIDAQQQQEIERVKMEKEIERMRQQLTEVSRLKDEDDFRGRLQKTEKQREQMLQHINVSCELSPAIPQYSHGLCLFTNKIFFPWKKFS